jgi:septal ring factor EnvC (AmiA/AmiB activator)
MMVAQSGMRPVRRRLLRRAPAIRNVLAFLIAGAILSAGTGLRPGFTLAQEAGSLNDRIKEQKKELDKIQEEMKLHREKSKELKEQEQSLLKNISSLEKDATLSQKLLAGAQNQEDLLTQKIDSLKTRLGIEQEKLSYQRERLNRRVRQLYMQGPHFKWAMLLGSKDIQEMLRTQKFMRLVTERDAQLVSAVRDNTRAIEHEQAELTEALVDVAALRKMREDESATLKKTRSNRVAMLNRVKGEKSKHEQAIRELQQAEERLKSLLEAMEKSRLKEKDLGIAGAVDFAALKGKLMRPVDGTVVKPFGSSRHPTFGTVTFNSGVDIRAAAGAPIRAVAPGKVEFVDWIAGYGQCLIVNHGGGYYTLYAHVAQVFAKPQQAVAAGEVIAEVGDTGSMEGFVCHFEIRKSKEALNPSEWFAR